MYKKKVVSRILIGEEPDGIISDLEYAGNAFLTLHQIASLVAYQAKPIVAITLNKITRTGCCHCIIPEHGSRLQFYIPLLIQIPTQGVVQGYPFYMIKNNGFTTHIPKTVPNKPGDAFRLDWFRRWDFMSAAAA